MVFDLLAPPWREVRLNDLDRPEILRAVLAAKRAMHTGPALTRRWDVFAEIDALAGPGAPADLLDAVPRLKPETLVPCHNNGTVCNIMLHPDGGIRRGTEMFIDRAVAMDASRKAHALGIGPAIHDWLAWNGVEIADFITDRRPCGLGDFDDAQVCEAVIDAYRTFHAAPALGLTKTVFDMIGEHVVQVRDLGGWRPLDIAGLDARVAEARDAILAAGLDLVPCFNDPMPGNFLVGKDRSVMLIDCEYASNNDRSYDLGAWFGEMFFSPGKAASLIGRYAGRPDPGVLARATVYQALADIKWATWSMVQERISEVDFDYRKYGVWKYMRARHIFDDPRWPVWLDRIGDRAVLSSGP